MSTVTKRPRLSVDELQQLRWLLGGVLGLVSAWTVVFMDIGAWWLLALVTLGGVSTLLRPDWPALVPGWAHRLVVPVVVAVMIADIYAHREPLPAFVRLNLMLIGYRLICPRTRREDLQLIVLGLFSVVVAGVLTVSVAFAGQILVFAACALALLLSNTLVDSSSAGGAKSPSGPQAPSWSANVNWPGLLGRVRAATDWRVAALAAALFAGVVVVSGLLFLVIPRFELGSSLFIDRLINRQTRTGFSDEVRFGEVTDIINDNSVALNVDVSDPSRMPAQPYWRMVVLDDYVGGGFRISAELRRDLNRSAATATRLRGPGRWRDGDPEWTFYLEPGVSRYLPLLGNYAGLSFTEAQSVGLSRAQRIVALQRDPPRMFAYRVSGMETAPFMPHAEFASERRSLADSPPTDAPGTVGAEGWARLRTINEEITGSEKPGAAEYARRAGEWLAARHVYSLQSALPRGEGDPLIRWLESDEPGHCELFAGALVLLARDAGYPARLVVGFRGGTWNSFSNSFTVRNSNAHAWVELFDDAAGGWLRVDPTPGNQTVATEEGDPGDLAFAAAASDSGWSARIEGLRMFWYRRIVNFDQSGQLELARAAKGVADEGGRRLREGFERLRNALKTWWDRPWDAGRWSGIGATMAVAASGFLFWRSIGRGWWLRWRSGRRGSSRTDPVRAQAGIWLRRLHEGGPESAAMRADLERLRYGPRETWPDPGPVFAKARRVVSRRAGKAGMPPG